VHPAVNQIEVHPFNTRAALTAFCRQHNIVVEAYSPLVRAERMDNDTVQAVARKYQRTPAQVLLRWSLQKGFVPLPKSVRRERMVENAAVGGFALAADDMEKLDALDEYLCTGKPTHAPRGAARAARPSFRRWVDELSVSQSGIRPTANRQMLFSFSHVRLR
jgi:diketogulonate reductase-like aldo/keto reductase